MNTFLNKHNIDVGKAFSVMIFAGMIQEIYSLLFTALTGSGIFLNLGIIIMYFLGVGMWRHRESSRRSCLFLLYVGALVVSLVIVFEPLSGIVAFDANGHVVEEPPLWSRLIFLGLLTPIFYVLISALHSDRAIHEFSANTNEEAEQVGDGDAEEAV